MFFGVHFIIVNPFYYHIYTTFSASKKPIIEASMMYDGISKEAEEMKKYADPECAFRKYISLVMIDMRIKNALCETALLRGKQFIAECVKTVFVLLSQRRNSIGTFCYGRIRCRLLPVKQTIYYHTGIMLQLLRPGQKPQQQLPLRFSAA